MCIHQQDGLGVSEPASVVTYQSFFVSATLPYSAIRGETVPIALTVFNYLDSCLPVCVLRLLMVGYYIETYQCIELLVYSLIPAYCSMAY